jgi:3-oxoacyl-[acyl-carrier-protein] synthase II
MSDRRRVWITGVGLLTAAGIGRDAFWDGVRAARSPVRRIDRFDPSPFRSQVAAQVDAFDPLDQIDAQDARRLDRFSQFCISAGRLALADAGLTPGAGGQADRQRIGVYVGSALGGIAFAELQHERYLERGIKAVAPTLALAVFGGAAPANLGIALDVRGPILSTANSCASGSVAIGEAVAAIRAGEIDAAIAGGVEVPLSPLAFGAFDIIRALSPGSNHDPEHACRPFDARRDGFVMGEGAGLVVLEAEDVARRRAAQPYAEVLGYAATSDAYHMVQPRPDGIEAGRAASLALAEGEVSGAEIDYVNAHASSTPIGDVAEARAIELALGERARSVPVSGTKALYGHPLGASGGIEAALCALVIRCGWAPPSVNLDTADDASGKILPGLIRDPLGRTGRFDRVLSTSFGFGGLNAALVLGSVAAP